MPRITILLPITMMLVLLGSLTATPVLQAQDTDLQSLLDEAAGPEGAGFAVASDRRTELARIAGVIANGFLSLIGLIFVSYTVYGGYLWLISSGNEERVTKAKSIIRNGIIGLIVILSAAAIYFVVSNTLIGPRTGGGGISVNP